jgi:hypothetical protein
MLNNNTATNEPQILYFLVYTNPMMWIFIYFIEFRVTCYYSDNNSQNYKQNVEEILKSVFWG